MPFMVVLIENKPFTLQYTDVNEHYNGTKTWTTCLQLFIC